MQLATSEAFPHQLVAYPISTGLPVGLSRWTFRSEKGPQSWFPATSLCWPHLTCTSSTGNYSYSWVHQLLVSTSLTGSGNLDGPPVWHCWQSAYGRPRGLSVKALCGETSLGGPALYSKRRNPASTQSIRTSWLLRYGLGQETQGHLCLPAISKHIC